MSSEPIIGVLTFEELGPGVLANSDDTGGVFHWWCSCGVSGIVPTREACYEAFVHHSELAHDA